MKIKEISIGVARSFNLGNDGWLKVEAGLTATIEEGDDLESWRPKLLEEIRRSLSASYRANHPRFQLARQSNPSAANPSGER
jgi:hypothetical protein